MDGGCWFATRSTESLRGSNAKNVLLLLCPLEMKQSKVAAGSVCLKVLDVQLCRDPTETLLEERLMVLDSLAEVASFFF